MNVPILLYHSISKESSDRFRQWTITPEQFGEHLGFLHREGYSPMTLTDLVSARSSPAERLTERPVVITFDDGFADFYQHALEQLERFGFPATVFITTGFIGATSRWLAALGEGSRPMMHWAQIEELPRHGIEIGAHSVTHPQLDTLHTERAFAEIIGSKEKLEECLGLQVHTFAYPHGYHSRETRALVKRAGFTSACAVKHGMSSLTDDPFALARIIITRFTGMKGLAGMLEGKGLVNVTRQENLRTTGWRTARRLLAMWNRHRNRITRGRTEYGGYHE